MNKNYFEISVFVWMEQTVCIGLRSISFTLIRLIVKIKNAETFDTLNFKILIGETYSAALCKKRRQNNKNSTI